MEEETEAGGFLHSENSSAFPSSTSQFHTKDRDSCRGDRHGLAFTAVAYFLTENPEGIEKVVATAHHRTVFAK